MNVDQQNNWKVRTETIDLIAQQITEKLLVDPMIVLNQSDLLMDFFVQMLSDQNFKIVVTTLTIINQLLYLTLQHMHSEAFQSALKDETTNALTSKTLGRYVP